MPNPKAGTYDLHLGKELHDQLIFASRLSGRSMANIVRQAVAKELELILGTRIAVSDSRPGRPPREPIASEYDERERRKPFDEELSERVAEYIKKGGVK